MLSTFPPQRPSLPLLSFVLLVSTSVVQALVSYANDFVDPDYIVKGDFGQHTLAAQSTIADWAKESVVGGPWCARLFAVIRGGRLSHLSFSRNKQTVRGPFWR